MSTRPGGLIEEELTYSVIGGFLKVHRTLGFGFVEPIYGSAMECELRSRGHETLREFGVTVWYEGIAIGQQRLDMVVDQRLIIEIKSTERLHKDACRQLYNYLRATNLEFGLLLHFGREANFYRLICENSRSPGIIRL